MAKIETMPKIKEKISHTIKPLSNFLSMVVFCPVVYSEVLPSSGCGVVGDRVLLSINLIVLHRLMRD